MAAPRKRCKTEREAGQNSAIKMMTEVGAVLEEGLAQAQTCKFLQLPHEAFLHIAAFLGPADVAALSRTCRKAHAIVSNDNILWRDVVCRDLGADVSREDVTAQAAIVMSGGHYADCNPSVEYIKRNPLSISWRSVCMIYRVNAQVYRQASRFPVHRAIEEKDTLAALYMLRQARGLKIDVSERDLDGISVLDTASSVGDLIVTRVLCIRGLADPGESAPDGWSPLMKACANGDVAMTSLLLSLGAARTINARTSHYSWTALHYACKGRHHECARLLLEFGADKWCKDFASRVPVELWGSSTFLGSASMRSPPCPEERIVQRMLQTEC